MKCTWQKGTGYVGVACEREHMPACIIMRASFDRPWVILKLQLTEASLAVWQQGFLLFFFLPGLQSSVQWYCAGLSGPESNHSNVCCSPKSHSLAGAQGLGLSFKKGGFSRLLPYSNYFNWIWAIALIGWGKAPAAATSIGCLDTSEPPPIGCPEESGRRAHPILPLWQSV